MVGLQIIIMGTIILIRVGRIVMILPQMKIKVGPEFLKKIWLKIKIFVLPTNTLMPIECVKRLNLI